MPTHPFPVIAGVYYAIIQGDADARPVSNVFCFHRAGTPLAAPADAANAMAVAGALSSAWNAPAANLLHTVYVGTQVKCYALGSPLIPPAIVPNTATGGVAGTQHMVQAAGIIKHTVYRRGKGSQSRTSLSPLSLTSVTVNGDQVTDTWFAEANTRMTTFNNAVIADLVAYDAGTWTYVQLSKGTIAVPGGGIFNITATNAERLVGSQRRRLGR